MSLPSTTVTTIDAAPVQSAVLDSTQAFVAVEMFRGPTSGPVKITSSRTLQQVFERAGVGIPGYDAVDILLREGVPTVWVSRIVGPAVAKATANLAGGSGTSLVVTAKEPGDWGNGTTGGLAVDTDVSGGVVTVKIYRNGLLVEQSPGLTTRAALVQWSIDTSKLVDITLGGDTTLPVATGSATNLAGGNADTAGITDTQLRTALDRFGVDLGPGQVLIPGRTTVASNTQALQHAAANDRVVFVEGDDSLSVSATNAVNLQLRALGTGAEGIARLGGAWVQRGRGPGFTPGTTRSVPWTVIQAGLTARAEIAAGHANVSPSGDLGVPRWATSVSRTFTDAEAESLFANGANIVEMYLGLPRNVSFRTFEDETVSEWVELAHSRLERSIVARAGDIGRQMQSRTIDGRNLLINFFGTQLRLMLNALWTIDAIYGATPDEAYIVDVGPSQNTPESIADRELHAAVGVKMSPHAEQVFIELARVPVDQAF